MSSVAQLSVEFWFLWLLIGRERKLAEVNVELSDRAHLKSSTQHLQRPFQRGVCQIYSTFQCWDLISLASYWLRARVEPEREHQIGSRPIRRLVRNLKFSPKRGRKKNQNFYFRRWFQRNKPELDRTTVREVDFGPHRNEVWSQVKKTTWYKKLNISTLSCSIELIQSAARSIWGDLSNEL